MSSAPHSPNVDRLAAALLQAVADAPPALALRAVLQLAAQLAVEADEQAKRAQQPERLTLDQAAQHLGLAKATLRKAVRAGRLKPSGFATAALQRKRPLFSPQDLDGYTRGNARAIGPAGLLRDPRPRGPRRPRLAACSGPRPAAVYGSPVAA